MKCLTSDESQGWLTLMDVQIDGNRNLLLPIRPENVMTTMPSRIDNLNFFSARLVDWMPNDGRRLVWLSDWNTFPNQYIPFLKFRLGCGEARPPIEAPGHLFEISNEEEDAIMAGILFFVMAFNWAAYIVSENRKDYIYLGDEHIVFSGADADRTRMAHELINDYKLKVIKDIREAWT
jgi:hypothetical protein